MKAQLVLEDGFDDLEVVGPYEVLAMAREAGPAIDVRLVTPKAADRVTSGGVTSGIAMALWLVGRHFGPDMAQCSGPCQEPQQTRFVATQPGFVATDGKSAFRLPPA
jgi:transcriptional regulator GlxA family with amidase domain